MDHEDVRMGSKVARGRAWLKVWNWWILAVMVVVTADVFVRLCVFMAGR